MIKDQSRTKTTPVDMFKNPVQYLYETQRTWPRARFGVGLANGKAVKSQWGSPHRSKFYNSLEKHPCLCIYFGCLDTCRVLNSLGKFDEGFMQLTSAQLFPLTERAP